MRGSQGWTWKSIPRSSMPPVYSGPREGSLRHMSIDWLNELTDQLEFHWQLSLMRRLEGLTDEEYFWEPVAGCWTIRPADDGRFLCDGEWPAPEPPPFTTI